MNNKVDFELEKKYLDDCKKQININISNNNKQIREISNSIDSSLYDFFKSEDNKGTDYEHMSSNDDFAMLSRDLLDEKSTWEILLKQNSYLEKMKKFPFFSKITFDKEDYYLGINTLFDSNNNIMIVDWRAPIADLYYESKVGDTYYKTERNIIKGNLSLKRQFIIEKGTLIDYIDNNLMIDDPLLLNELSKNSSDKLKNIVSTIQLEQNKAIKADIDKNLLVLGVAGSGKTSVAIHRISYLIYRNSKEYSSNKIAILSPNSFFFNYIDNILPSLGEDNVINYDISYLIDIIIKNYNLRIEGKEKYFANLFDNYNKMKPIINNKKVLDEFIAKEIVKYIKDIDFKIYTLNISHKEICNYFSKNMIDNRLGQVIRSFKISILDYLNNNLIKISKEEKLRIFNDINHMFNKINCLSILNNFLGTNYKEKDTLEYYDGVYLAYIILKIHKVKEFYGFNHLVIDEVQDYSNVELEIINMLFGCNKTVVGDINQIINMKFEYEFKNYNKIELLNSYRSSKEIFDFISCLIPASDTISVMRHGNKPIIEKCLNFEDEHNKLLMLINSYKGTTLIICKNKKEMDKWYSLLKNELELKKVNEKNNCKVIISTIYECKGLEFDNVIVLDVNDNNYSIDIESNWLYIACSRAMHNLHLFYYGKISRFINNINKQFYKNK